jgi:hypothetical protein
MRSMRAKALHTSKACGCKQSMRVRALIHACGWKVLRREIADINETWSRQRNPLYQRQAAGAQEAGGGAGGR